jgi:hypothetical protein
MAHPDAAQESGDDDDFERWYFGGSPPTTADAWPRHAFEEALHGAPDLQSSPRFQTPASTLSLDQTESRSSESASRKSDSPFDFAIV